MTPSAARICGKALSSSGQASRHRGIWIRTVSRSVVLLAAATSLSACAGNEGTVSNNYTPTVGSPNDTSCTQLLPPSYGVGGCPNGFDDKTTWRDELCPLASGTDVFEQSCPGYLLREFHIGTRLRRCYYGTFYRELQAAYVVDDAKNYCGNTSKTVFYGVSQYDEGCDKPAVKLADPCNTGNPGSMCLNPPTDHPAPPCPDGWYLYEDTVCGPPDASRNQTCSSNGDHRCYQPCGTAADCTDPCFSACAGLTVFRGSDAGDLKFVCL